MTSAPTNDWSKQLRAHIASAIRDAREKRGMSASALADATEGVITRDTIANLESGRKRVIDIAELIVLAKALEVPPVSLIYARGNAVEQSPVWSRQASTRRSGSPDTTPTLTPMAT
ncbi:helix-turn-helix domain-containing protein [Mycobacterium avium]|uniref:helix-turn-helix domain-containing protein n=1 Tax=Mycobacterium avium TaxID=1764 RepID=UPI0009B843DA